MEFALAALAIGGVLVYVGTRPRVKNHWKPIVASVGFAVGVVAMLAALWSHSVANAVAKFVLSPGLGSLAAVAAAGLALYGVFRQLDARRSEVLDQLEARRSEQQEADARNRADQYAAHFRWVCERVLESTKSTDTPVIEFLIQDLFERAVGEKDEAAAIALLNRHIDRLKDAPVVAEASGEEVTKRSWLRRRGAGRQDRRWP